MVPPQDWGMLPCSRLPLLTPSPGKLLDGGLVPEPVYVSITRDRPADRHQCIVKSSRSMTTNLEVRSWVEITVVDCKYVEAHNPPSVGTRRWGWEEVIIRSPERMGLGSPESTLPLRHVRLQ